MPEPADDPAGTGFSGLRRLRRAERILREDIVKRGIGHRQHGGKRGAGNKPAGKRESFGFKGNPP